MGDNWSLILLGASIIPLTLRFCRSNHSNLFCYFQVKKTLQVNFIWLCKCKYICMQVCIYVVTFLLPISHNLLEEYFNDEVFQLHQKDPDIVSQKISLFGAYGKLSSCWWERMRKFLAGAGLLIPYSSRNNPLIWSQHRPKLPNLISDELSVRLFVNLTILL